MFNINFFNDKKDIFIHKDYESLSTNNTYPHFDVERKLKFYICLNKMNLSNGCFKVLPNSIKMVENIRNTIGKRKNIFNEGHNNFNGISLGIEKLVPLEADAGDLIIFDTNCIHAGGDKFDDGKFRKVIRLHLILNSQFKLLKKIIFIKYKIMTNWKKTESYDLTSEEWKNKLVFTNNFQI